jgi:hypothetical protein
LKKKGELGKTRKSSRAIDIFFFFFFFLLFMTSTSIRDDPGFDRYVSQKSITRQYFSYSSGKISDSTGPITPLT